MKLLSREAGSGGSVGPAFPASLRSRYGVKWSRDRKPGSWEGKKKSQQIDFIVSPRLIFLPQGWSGLVIQSKWTMLSRLVEGSDLFYGKENIASLLLNTHLEDKSDAKVPHTCDLTRISFVKR